MEMRYLRKKIWVGILLLAAVVPLHAFANETITTVSTRCSESMGTCTMTTTTWVRYPDGTIWFVGQTTVTVPYVRPNPPRMEQ